LLYHVQTFKALFCGLATYNPYSATSYYVMSLMNARHVLNQALYLW